MHIRNVVHKGLRAFIGDDDASGLQPHSVGKLRRMISFLQYMAQESELQAVPAWKAHRLSSERKGQWRLFVTRNWRLSFAIDRTDIEIIDLDYQDYH